jgi:hypothetical protein
MTKNLPAFSILHKALQNLPKLGFLVLKLATLRPMPILAIKNKSFSTGKVSAPVSFFLPATVFPTHFSFGL